MKVLSIKQPWAWLIINGGKDIENRVWKTKFRGRFLVHASQAVDKKAMKWFVEHHNPDDLIHGAIIGSVELKDIFTEGDPRCDSRWYQGPYGFVLREPRPEPIRFIKGRLRFFEEPR